MLSRVSDLEQELSRARLQCEHYQTSLSQARDRVARLLSGASEGVCSVEQTQELLEWMESLKTLPGEDRVKSLHGEGGIKFLKTLPGESGVKCVRT